MYERMLDKNLNPSFDDLINFSGKAGSLWIEIDQWLKSEFELQSTIRFPYGNNYGWGIKYYKGSKHICDIFAENNAFTVFTRINNKAFITIQNNLSVHSIEIYEKKYLCGDGGWINYRILSVEHLGEIKKILSAKIKIK